MKTQIKTASQKLIIGLVVSSTAIFTLAFAAALPAKFYASTFDAQVGQPVEFELKVDPSAAQPVYTVIANLEYDHNLLTFKGASYQAGWIPVTPDEVTDTANGVIKRTAGYPSGATALTSIVKYQFVAAAPGKAVVNITGGSAYDANSNDMGLQNKSITVNIGGKAVPEATPAPTPSNPNPTPAAKKVTQVITLAISGDTAVAADKDYNFTIAQKFKVNQDTVGTTSVSIFDINGQEVLKQDQVFTSNTDNTLTFNVPANSLVPGNYSLVATTIHDNQKTPERMTKDLGVLASTEKVVNTTTQVPVIPVYIWVIIGILVLILLLVLIYNKSKAFRKFIKNF